MPAFFSSSLISFFCRKYIYIYISFFFSLLVATQGSKVSQLQILEFVSIFFSLYRYLYVHTNFGRT